jgi:hypothetical protein
MAEDDKPRSPIDDARDALRKARQKLAPGIKAASVVLEPAARAAKEAAKEVAWEARRAVRPEKLHDQVNKALGLDPAHEVAVDGVVYRIAKTAELRFEAHDARTDALQGTFTCDNMGHVRSLDAHRAEIRKLLAIAEEAVRAGLAP